MIVHKHIEYDNMYPRWLRCRDVFEGSDAVKLRRLYYLPKLSGMSNNDYDVYIGNALFTNLSSRILEAFIGMILRKDPEIEAPAEMSGYFEKDENGQSSFREILRSTVEEVLSVGRFGLFVDAATDSSEPYITTYDTEDIVNWILDDQGRPLAVVLAESYYAPYKDDKYDQREFTRYRYLELDGGVFKVNTYNGDEPVDIKAGMSIGSLGAGSTNTFSRHLPPANESSVVQFVPTNENGGLMDEIPFYCITPKGVNFNIYKPPLVDVVDINLSHFRTSADLEHGRHFTALPTPVVSGASADTTIKIGSTTALVLTDPHAKAYYMEFSGEGLRTLERALDNKRSQMSDFAARMADSSSKGSEALEAVKLRYSSDAAKLDTTLHAVESGLNVTYNSVRKRRGLSGQVKITLDKELLKVDLSSADLRELFKAYIDGTIDDEVLNFNLDRGGFSPPNYVRPTRSAPNRTPESGRGNTDA